MGTLLLPIAILLSLAAPAGTSAGAAAQPKYSVTDLGTLGGATVAFGINERGQVVGCSALSGSTCGHAFLFHEGGLSDLGTLSGGDYSVAYALNDRGQVAGISGLTGVDSGLPFGHAFLFSDRHMRDLGTLGGTWSEAFGINARGNVVGGAAIAGDVAEHAFLYRKGRMTDLNPPGSSLSVAFGINDSNTTVGFAYFAAGVRAFVYRHGHATELGTLGGSGSEAKAVNGSGEVVGGATLAGDTTLHAFLYRHHRMIDLGSLGGDSEAQAINDDGDIVGYSRSSPGTGGPPGGPIQHLDAFISDGGAMVNLNDLIAAGSGWELEWATGINNRGQIVGFGIHGTERRAFLLTPLNDA